MKKILIAIDLGPSSQKVAQQGFEIARQLNAEIAILSVVDTNLLITDGSITSKEMAEMIRNDLMKKQELLTDSVFKGEKIFSFIEEGNPYETILKVADEWEADVIVLGARGKAGLAHLFVGSVAEKVIRHSTKPILIVPAK